MIEQQVSVLVVAVKERNLELVSQLVREYDYLPVTASSLAEVDRLLTAGSAKESDVSLAVIDADGFGPGIWKRCQQLRKLGIPFLLLSLDTGAVEQKGWEHGAGLVLEKPVGKRSLLESMRTLSSNS